MYDGELYWTNAKDYQLVLGRRASGALLAGIDHQLVCLTALYVHRGV